MSRDEMWGTSDARLGCQERRAVQLRELRGAGFKGSSVAADPADCGQSAGGAVAGIRKAVRPTRPASIPPEGLLRALLLQAFYSVRSELQLIFPWHRRTDAQVPYKSPNESHASYTPGTAWPVGRFPPHSS